LIRKSFPLCFLLFSFFSLSSYLIVFRLKQVNRPRGHRPHVHTLELSPIFVVSVSLFHLFSVSFHFDFDFAASRFLFLFDFFSVLYHFGFSIFISFRFRFVSISFCFSNIDIDRQRCVEGRSRDRIS
jgi:hypothetical protein